MTADTASSASSAAADVARSGVQRVLWITLFLNVAVCASKIVVGKLSGSVSMVADGYHSLLDGSNNLVGLVVAHLAYQPPDDKHPYGHRKFETAATLLIGLALLTLAYNVVEEALGSAAHSRTPDITALNWIVMGVTLGVNLFVTSYESRQGRRLGSAYLTADAAHTKSDIYVTLGVIASFAGARAGLPWTDSLVAVAIAAFVAYLAVRILIGAFHTLTDRAALPIEELMRVVREDPQVLDCHDVRTRGGPGAVYVDLSVHADGHMTLKDAHDVADRIEAALKRARPEIVDVVVHVEPADRT